MTSDVDRKNVRRRFPIEEKLSNHRIRRSSCFPHHMGAEISPKWSKCIILMIHDLIRIIKSNKIHAIIVGQAQMFLTLSAFIASSFTKRPYILFFHGEEIPQIYLRSNKYLKWLYVRADGYFCNSHFTARRLEKFIGDPKIKPAIITPGVEERFFQKPRNLHKLKEHHGLQDRKILYTIARLDVRKGFDMVIKALPRIAQKYPDVIYLIGGKGPDEYRLKKLVKNNALEHYVKFLGFVPDDELVSWHYLGDVFVMPNRILADGDSEGFGIVFLEANAAGNPVIGGNEGGSVDAIVDGTTGFLVDPVDTEDISEKILYLLKDENLRTKMGAAGKKRAWEEFRWPQLAEKFESSILAILRLEE